MKKSRLLSVLLTLVMLASMFFVAGMSATAVTLPNEAYELQETVVVQEALNRTKNSNADKAGTYANSTYSGAGTGGYATNIKCTITDASAMYAVSRAAINISAHGNLKTIPNFIEKFNDYCISFDLTVSEGFGNSKMRMEFRGKSATGTSDSLGFDYPLTAGTTHVCIPVSSLTHFSNTKTYNVQNWINSNCTGFDYVYLIVGKNTYSADCVDNSYFEINNFSIVDTSTSLMKQETEKNLSDSDYTLSFAKNSANPLTLEKVSNFEIGGTVYNGFRGTVSDAAKFNTNNTELLYTFDKSVDLTETLADAKLSFWLRLGGSLANTTTPRIRVAVVTKLLDGTEKNAYQNVSLAKTGDWQKVTLNIATDLPYGGVGINNCAIDNLVAIKFSNIGSSKYLQTDDTDGLTPDALEIADVKISKTVTAPVNASAIDLKISKVSLTLQDNLTMNFKVAKSLFDEKYTNPYVMVGERKLDGVVEGNYYVFSYDGISPQNIRNTIAATVYATYGGQVLEGKTLEYSVKKYCDTLIASSSDARTRALVVDLLNYGAAAQSYAGVRVNNPANRDLSTEQINWGTTTDATVNNYLEERGEEGSVTWEGASLTLDDSVIVNLKFKADSKENLSVKISDGTTVLAELSGDDIKIVDDSFVVSFDGLNAKNMRRLLYVTVYNGETAENVSNELVYSVESYVKQVIDLAAAGDTTVDAKLVTLVTAMMKYGDAAFAYAVR